MQREKNTQQLGRRNTYTPTDAAPVRSNCDSSLKVPRGKDGVASLKTLPNNSEEQERSPACEPKAESLVYVINKNGRPLMPCKPAKARHLLESGKAKVVYHNPFTIQLLWDCEENVDELVLGIDAGYKTIGYSVVSQTVESRTPR